MAQVFLFLCGVWYFFFAPGDQFFFELDGGDFYLRIGRGDQKKNTCLLALDLLAWAENACLKHRADALDAFGSAGCRINRKKNNGQDHWKGVLPIPCLKKFTLR